MAVYSLIDKYDRGTGDYNQDDNIFNFSNFITKIVKSLGHRARKNKDKSLLQLHIIYKLNIVQYLLLFFSQQKCLDHNKLA